MRRDQRVGGKLLLPPLHFGSGIITVDTAHIRLTQACDLIEQRLCDIVIRVVRVNQNRELEGVSHDYTSMGQVRNR